MNYTMLVQSIVSTFGLVRPKVIDVCSLGDDSLRQAFLSVNSSYVGLHPLPGQNVDIVANTNLLQGHEDYDVAVCRFICHLEFPLLVVMSMKRALREGGILVLLAENRNSPTFCRFNRPGLDFLLAGFSSIALTENEGVACAVGVKPPGYSERWKVIDSLLNVVY